jgi:hypothetical protein
MKVIGFIALACLGFAILRAAFVVVLVAYIGLLLLSLIRHPQETFGIMVLWGTVALLDRHPLVALAVVGGVWLLARQKKVSHGG